MKKFLQIIASRKKLCQLQISTGWPLYQLDERLSHRTTVLGSLVRYPLGSVSRSTVVLTKDLSSCREGKPRVMTEVSHSDPPTLSWIFSQTPSMEETVSILTAVLSPHQWCSSLTSPVVQFTHLTSGAVHSPHQWCSSLTSPVVQFSHLTSGAVHSPHQWCSSLTSPVVQFTHLTSGAVSQQDQLSSRSFGNGSKTIQTLVLIVNSPTLL